MTLERFVEIMRKGGATNEEIQSRMTKEELANIFDLAFPQGDICWMFKHYNIENKINAIKRVRELVGCGLKEAKDFVEGQIPLTLTIAQQKDLNDYLTFFCCGLHNRTINAAYVE